MVVAVKSIAIVTVALLSAGCATNGIAIPQAETAAAQLYAEKCSACHALPHPARHSAGEWPHYVALMEQRMSERNKRPLSDEQRSVILSYLSQHAR